MILNTGNRTDIPAFFSRWFLNRIREGYVYTRSPYDPGHLTEYTLDPELVDVICFCSKNPAPLLPHLGDLAAFPQYWQVTITPYGKDIEPYVPPKKQVMETFRSLSKITGPHSLAWRYDPIFLTSKYSLEFHLSSFKEMARALRGAADTVIISFIDLYEKTKRNFPGVHTVSEDSRLRIGEQFADIARSNGMTLKTCLEGDDLAQFGVDTSGCMTKEVLERSLGEALQVPASQPRKGCRCLLGNDIGMYNTCGHGCLYCYANYDQKSVAYNLRHHDPDSPLLIGHPQPTDKIVPANQVSFRTGQITLF